MDGSKPAGATIEPAPEKTDEPAAVVTAPEKPIQETGPSKASETLPDAAGAPPAAEVPTPAPAQPEAAPPPVAAPAVASPPVAPAPTAPSPAAPSPTTAEAPNGFHGVDPRLVEDSPNGPLPIV
ncbi:MAG TPA: hypothetical protein VGN75_04245, partial [Kaistia sp.]|nr:hypothetical protein [Kaistia sp.]